MVSEQVGRNQGTCSVENNEMTATKSFGDRRESLDNKKVKEIKARCQSLDSKQDNVNYELVRINTKLNAKASIIEDEAPRKAKSKKRVTFDEMAPTASDYFAEKESDLISLMINPLSVDTGDELSFKDMLPNFSFDSEDLSLAPVAESVSPATVDLPISQNNTIIKRKKKITSPEPETNFDTSSELEYYLGQESIQREKLSSTESDDTIISGDFMFLNTAAVNSVSKVSDQVDESRENLNIQTQDSLENLQEAELESSISNPNESYKSDSFISMEKYNESISKFYTLESSYRLLEEENKNTNSKYEELLSKFSILEATNGKIEQDNKITEQKLLDSVCENSSLTLKYENALHETKQHMKGILTEVKILQLHVKAYKRQINTFDEEIF